MFGIGWQELFVIVLIAILVVGPTQMPRVVRGVAAGMRKMRSIAGEFQAGVDEVIRQADIEDIQKTIGQSVDPEDEIRQMIDPNRETAAALQGLADNPEEDSGKNAAKEDGSRGDGEDEGKSERATEA